MKLLNLERDDLSYNWFFESASCISIIQPSMWTLNTSYLPFISLLREVLC